MSCLLIAKNFVRGVLGQDLITLSIYFSHNNNIDADTVSGRTTTGIVSTPITLRNILLCPITPNLFHPPKTLQST